MAELNNLVQQIISSDDLKRLESTVRLLSITVQCNKEDTLSIQSDIKFSKDDTKNVRDDVSRLRTKLDLIETKTAYMAKSMAELGSHPEQHRDAIKKLSLKRSPSGRSIFDALSGQSSVSDSEYIEIKSNLTAASKNIAEIFAELESMRDLKKKYIAMDRELSTKLGVKEFEEWGRSNDMGKVAMEMDKKFIDKTEVIVMFKKLKSRIVTLEEAGTKDGSPESNENAMFAKKPLGGWSCASCQKDLVNLEGSKALFYPPATA